VLAPARTVVGYLKQQDDDHQPQATGSSGSFSEADEAPYENRHSGQYTW
jgi:hypothetical protein